MIARLAVLTLIAAVPCFADEAADKYLKSLEGEYTVESMTKGGMVAAKEQAAAITMAFKGNTITLTVTSNGKSEAKSAVIVVDPSQKPTAIDLTPKDGDDAGKPMLGIVNVEKDTVTLCLLNEPGATRRPTEFKSTADNKCYLVVLKKK